MLYAIIGPVKSDKITKNLFEAMIEKTKYYIPNRARVCSGGSSFAEHIAVRLNNQGYLSELIIYAPCPWAGDQYEDNGNKSWYLNPGGLLNLHHRRFSEQIEANSLLEIQEAINKGTIYIIGEGFHYRYREIAQSDVLIVFSWEQTEPQSSEIQYTWKHCRGKRILINLDEI